MKGLVYLNKLNSVFVLTAPGRQIYSDKWEIKPCCPIGSTLHYLISLLVCFSSAYTVQKENKVHLPVSIFGFNINLPTASVHSLTYKIVSSVLI